MSDYQSRYSGPQIDNMLDAVNASLVTPGSDNDSTLVGYRYLGIAVPATTPATTNSKIFYIANTPGTYTNFNNLTVAPGEVVIFKKVSNAWTKESFTALSTAYIVCDAAESDTNKNVTINGLLLSTSIRILVKMTHKNTASNVTFTINNAGSGNLYYSNAVVSPTNTWADGEVVDLYYDGASYKCFPLNSAPAQTMGQRTDIPMSQKAVSDNLQELQAEVFPLEVEFGRDFGPIAYSGTAVTLNLPWSVQHKGVAVIPTHMTIMQDGVIIEDSAPSAASGTLQVSLNKNGTTVFTGTFVADGLVKEVECRVTQYLRCYVGFYESGANLATMKNSLREILASEVTDLNGRYSNPTEGNDLIIACPSGVFSGIHVTSYGIRIPISVGITDDSLIINDVPVTYIVHRSSSETGINSGSEFLEFNI